MATTKYGYFDNTAWVEVGQGPCIITIEWCETLIHFGDTLPTTYGAGPHHHQRNEDVPFYYPGTQKVYMRTANNNISGVTLKGKASITEV